MRLFLTILFVLTINFFAQNKTVTEIQKLAGWKDAGLADTSPFSSNNIINIQDEIKKGKDYFNIIDEIARTPGNVMTILYFPAGEYKFTRPINLSSNMLIRGDGAGKTVFKFDLTGSNASAINIMGRVKRTVSYTTTIKAGDNFVLAENSPMVLNKNNIVEISLGKNVWGKSSSGNKKYQKSQILKVRGKLGNKYIFENPIRLDYEPKDTDGNKLHIAMIEPVENSGIENITLTRTDKPGSDGHAIIHLDYVYNCLISGVESTMGANNHVFLRNAKNCEVTGSYFSKSFNTGGGGNGYGVSVGNGSSDNLIEDNIFTELRHSIIFATSANGNVTAYNASFDKPSMNFDEASISLHGHYPYMNLFEGNYVEYICADYVWGENGPYNTFLRNEVYHDGLFGFLNSKLIEFEKGTNKTFVIANVGNIKSGGENFLDGNVSPSAENRGINHNITSLYKEVPKEDAVLLITDLGINGVYARYRFGIGEKTVQRKIDIEKKAKPNTSNVE